jgi:hypothetical protein
MSEIISAHPSKLIGYIAMAIKLFDGIDSALINSSVDGFGNIVTLYFDAPLDTVHLPLGAASENLFVTSFLGLQVISGDEQLQKTLLGTISPGRKDLNSVT